ncbi:MAG: thioredoxin family protein [Treponemataceae bacterium]
MIIKVIGTGCDKCNELYKNVQEALTQLGIEAEIEKVEDLVEIVNLGVMTAPSLMINGKLVVSGRVPKVKNLIEILQKNK